MSENEFTEEDIEKLGTLSRIKIKPDERASLAEDLSSILGYIHKLDQYDVSEVEPLSHVHGSTNVMRADSVKEYDNKEGILNNTPDRSGTFIKVPLIVRPDEEA